jgi:hypothetical protein
VVAVPDSLRLRILRWKPILQGLSTDHRRYPKDLATHDLIAIPERGSTILLVAVVIATLHIVPLTSNESDPFNFADSCVRSFARALPKRDIIVPIGQSRMLAIS